MLQRLVDAGSSAAFWGESSRVTRTGLVLVERVSSAGAGASAAAAAAATRTNIAVSVSKGRFRLHVGSWDGPRLDGDGALWRAAVSRPGGVESEPVDDDDGDDEASSSSSLTAAAGSLSVSSRGRYLVLERGEGEVGVALQRLVDAGSSAAFFGQSRVMHTGLVLVERVSSAGAGASAAEASCSTLNNIAVNISDGRFRLHVGSAHGPWLDGDGALWRAAVSRPGGVESEPLDDDDDGDEASSSSLSAGAGSMSVSSRGRYLVLERGEGKVGVMLQRLVDAGSSAAFHGERHK
jgi:hypothetical protein